MIRIHRSVIHRAINKYEESNMKTRHGKNFVLPIFAVMLVSISISIPAAKDKEKHSQYVNKATDVGAHVGVDIFI